MPRAPRWARRPRRAPPPAADNGVPRPSTPAEINDFRANVFSASNPNVYYPLPGAKLFTAQFDAPTDVVGVTAQWFTVSFQSGQCPQLPKNSFVWVQLVPRTTTSLPTSGSNFYDGIKWLGAQNFLDIDTTLDPWAVGACGGGEGAGAGVTYTTPVLLAGAGRMIYSTATTGDTVNTCNNQAGLDYVKQPNWASLPPLTVPVVFADYTTAYGLNITGYANDAGCECAAARRRPGAAVMRDSARPAPRRLPALPDEHWDGDADRKWGVLPSCVCCLFTSLRPPYRSPRARGPRP